MTTGKHPAEKADSHNLVRGRTTLGQFEITVLTDGFFFMDGGAMFGVVPKTMWEKRTPADAQNRVLVGANTVVVRDGKHTVVIETGLGNKLNDKLRAIVGAQQLLPQAFSEAGISLDEVDFVVNSHLHFDHCGWNTTKLDDGRVVPTFPNARYFAHRGEVEHGHRQYERDAVSYLSDNYDPLVENGQMTLLTKPQEILPGISVEVYPGHTAQLMGIHIESQGKHACYISDLIPTSAHLDPTWVMSYDLDPLTCIEQRKRFYAKAIPQQWLVLFTHDHDVPFSYLEIGPKGKPVLKPSNGE